MKNYYFCQGYGEERGTGSLSTWNLWTGKTAFSLRPDLPPFKAHIVECSAMLLTSLSRCLLSHRHFSVHSVLGEWVGQGGCEPRLLPELGLHRARSVWRWLCCGFKGVCVCVYVCVHMCVWCEVAFFVKLSLFELPVPSPLWPKSKEQGELHFTASMLSSATITYMLSCSMVMTQHAYLCLSCWVSCSPWSRLLILMWWTVSFHVLRSPLPFSAVLAISASHF